jgi:hypothetical protein
MMFPMSQAYVMKPAKVEEEESERSRSGSGYEEVWRGNGMMPAVGRRADGEYV